MVDQFRRTKLEVGRKEIFDHYLRLLDENLVNNWDLIDSSAPYLGAYLIGRYESRQLLAELSKSPSLWKRRASIIFTFPYIRAGDFEPSIDIAERLLRDEQDLINKATGWMLREVGNRNLNVLRAFLTAHASYMPRTMLRYAIEKLAADERAEWLGKKAAAAKS
jgi:3-methyladenine DNA glycosylase AlkD